MSEKVKKVTEVWGDLRAVLNWAIETEMEKAQKLEALKSVGVSIEWMLNELNKKLSEVHAIYFRVKDGDASLCLCHGSLESHNRLPHPAQVPLEEPTMPGVQSRPPTPKYMLNLSDAMKDIIWVKSVIRVEKAFTNGYSIIGDFMVFNYGDYYCVGQLYLSCHTGGSKDQPNQYYYVLFTIDADGKVATLKRMPYSADWAVKMWPEIERFMLVGLDAFLKSGSEVGP